MVLSDVCIIKVNDSNEKSKIVKEVLLDLPEWFGLAKSTQKYIDQSRELFLFNAKQQDNIIGFITLKETSPDVCEIHCMGVKKTHHRQGIGIKLLNAMENFAKEKYLYMQVKTVAEGHYKEYDQTIAFYTSVGFKKMEVFPKLWDEWNPCLIMIKAI